MVTYLLWYQSGCNYWAKSLIIFGVPDHIWPIKMILIIKSHGCVTMTTPTAPLSILKFLTEKNIAVLEQSPYSPDQAHGGVSDDINGPLFEDVDDTKMLKNPSRSA